MLVQPVFAHSTIKMAPPPNPDKARLAATALQLAEANNQIAILNAIISEKDKFYGETIEEARKAGLNAVNKIAGATVARTEVDGILAKLEEETNKIKMSEERIEALQDQVAKLRDKLEDAEKNYSHVESRFEEKEKELKAAETKLRDRDASHQTTTEELRRKLKDAEKVESEASERILELEAIEKRLGEDLEKERGAHDALKRKCEGLEHDNAERLKDSVGISAELNHSQNEVTNLKATIESLQNALTGADQCERDLAAEREITTSIRAQIEKMRKDGENRFPLDPKAFQPASEEEDAKSTGPATLQEQMAAVGGSASGGSREGSFEDLGHLSEESDADAPSGDEVDDDDRTVQLPQNPQQAPQPQVVTTTIFVHTPSRRTIIHHNQLLCWWTVYTEMALYIGIWLRDSWTIDTPLAPNTHQSPASEGNSPAANHSASPSTNVDSNNPPNIAGATHAHQFRNQMSNIAVQGNNLATPSGPAEQTPDNGSANPEEAANTNAGRPDQLPPPLPFVDNRRVIPNAPGQGPPIPPSQDQQTDEKPELKSTFIAFLFHLAFYAACYMCYLNYAERSLWFSANELTRAFLRGILSHRGGYGRGVAAYIMSERWAAAFDRAMLDFVMLFGYQIKSFPLPG